MRTKTLSKYSRVLYPGIPDIIPGGAYLQGILLRDYFLCCMYFLYFTFRCVSGYAKMTKQEGEGRTKISEERRRCRPRPPCVVCTDEYIALLSTAVSILLLYCYYADFAPFLFGAESVHSQHRLPSGGSGTARRCTHTHCAHWLAYLYAEDPQYPSQQAAAGSTGLLEFENCDSWRVLWFVTQVTTIHINNNSHYVCCWMRYSQVQQ